MLVFLSFKETLIIFASISGLVVLYEVFNKLSKKKKKSKKKPSKTKKKKKGGKEIK